MAKSSSIQWTEATWNIARGCKKVDSDCKFCYMYRESFNGTRYESKEITRTKTVFDMPLKLKEPSKIFTCSLTDFFIEEIDSYRSEAWDIIRQCPQHVFQILTKRPQRIQDNLPDYWEEIKDRVWLGTSIGSQQSMHRLSDLILPIQPGIKFLSLEPLYSPIDLGLFEQIDFGHKVGDLIDWVIIGGESGNETGKYRYRPCKIEWFESIISQIQKFNRERETEIAIFVKQLGTHLSKELGLSDRHGGNIDELPEHLRIREFPVSSFVNLC